MNKKHILSRRNDWRRNQWQDIALPIVLMVTGLILLGGDYLGMLSLDRIQNLWPLALIVIGFLDLAPRNTTNSAGKETHARQLW